MVCSLEWIVVVVIVIAFKYLRNCKDPKMWRPVNKLPGSLHFHSNLDDLNAAPVSSLECLCRLQKFIYVYIVNTFILLKRPGFAQCRHSGFVSFEVRVLAFLKDPAFKGPAYSHPPTNQSPDFLVASSTFWSFIAGRRSSWRHVEVGGRGRSGRGHSG